MRSAGIPIPMGFHSHSPGMAHSREYDNFGNGNMTIPGMGMGIPGNFPFPAHLWCKVSVMYKVRLRYEIKVRY